MNNWDTSGLVPVGRVGVQIPTASWLVPVETDYQLVHSEEVAPLPVRTLFGGFCHTRNVSLSLSLFPGRMRHSIERCNAGVGSLGENSGVECLQPYSCLVSLQAAGSMVS